MHNGKIGGLISFSDSDLLLDTDLLSVQDLCCFDAYYATNSVTRRAPKDTWKMSKNDIRKFLPGMLINTINCGDFVQIKNFLLTFMSRHCSCRFSLEAASEFKLPEESIAKGPLFLHYVLGLHTMYPDMTGILTDFQIVTTSLSSETVINMNVEYNMTKTCHISEELWLPPEELLLELYSAKSSEDVARILKLSLPETSEQSILSFKLPRPEKSVQRPVIVDEKQQQQEQQEQQSECISPPMTRRRTRSRCHEEPPPPIASSSSKNTTSSGRSSRSKTPIPDVFLRTLQDTAELLPEPMSLCLRGQFEMRTNEYNHIIALHFRAKQIIE